MTTGLQTDRIRSIKEKSEMKKYYAKGDIPTARQIRAAEGFDAVSSFARQTDYPIIAKPDVGVGASGTYIAIDLKSFYASVECVDRGFDSNYIKHSNSESKSYHISAIFRNFAPRFY